jgi:hypothetical protein
MVGVHEVIGEIVEGRESWGCVGAVGVVNYLLCSSFQKSIYHLFYVDEGHSRAQYPGSEVVFQFSVSLCPMVMRGILHASLEKGV